MGENKEIHNYEINKVEKNILSLYNKYIFYIEKLKQYKNKNLNTEDLIEKYLYEKFLKEIKIQIKKLLEIKENLIKKSKKNIENLKNEKKYKRYSEKIEKEGLSNETKKIIIEAIYKKLKNKVVIINNKKIKFSNDFIEKNKKDFIKNIENFLIFLMNIESSGGKNIENKISSAKGPLQWIDGWKNGKKNPKFNRKLGKTSPFETALRRANLFYTNNKYPDFSNNKVPEYIRKAWENGGKLDIKQFDTEKQIQLWFLDIIMRKGKAIEYLMGTLLGNKWFSRKLYEKIHHTNVKKGDKTKKITNKYNKSLYLSRLY